MAGGGDAFERGSDGDGREITHPKGGTIRAVGSPVRFSRTPTRAERAGPLLGENTRGILAELGAEDADALEKAEIVGSALSTA